MKGVKFYISVSSQGVPPRLPGKGWRKSRALGIEEGNVMEAELGGRAV
jgi:hypothetical protein